MDGKMWFKLPKCAYKRTKLSYVSEMTDLRKRQTAACECMKITEFLERPADLRRRLEAEERDRKLEQIKVRHEQKTNKEC